jgi:hypothetical protein
MPFRSVFAQLVARQHLLEDWVATDSSILGQVGGCEDHGDLARRKLEARVEQRCSHAVA